MRGQPLKDIAQVCVRMSLSGILCVRHNMTNRSIYANKQNEAEERGDCRA
jgi:hypothetical protein